MGDTKKSGTMEQGPDIAAFMQHVHNQGFAIEDRGIVYDTVRRFVITGEGAANYFDIDKLIWNGLSQDSLIQQADIIMSGMKGVTTNEGKR